MFKNAPILNFILFNKGKNAAALDKEQLKQGVLIILFFFIFGFSLVNAIIRVS